MYNLVLKLNNNVLKRYEHNLNDGTVFLFDIAREEVWMGNAAADCLLRLIDGETPLKDIYDYLFPLFEGFSVEELKESFDGIVKNLVEKGFLMVENA